MSETISTKEHTEAHGDKIGGYKKLTDVEIELINRVKSAENEIGVLMQVIQDMEGNDKRWSNIAKTDLQKGFMALVRSIAKPESELR